MITIHVNAPDRALVPGELIERGLRQVLAEEGIDDAELSVTFVSDPEMVELHNRYLGRPGPTDVLSFALHDEGEGPLGDIYVGLDQARRQAREAGMETREELVRLAIHGALHVMGYDHPEDDRESSDMYRMQEALVHRVLTTASEASGGH